MFELSMKKVTLTQETIAAEIAEQILRYKKEGPDSRSDDEIIDSWIAYINLKLDFYCF